MSNSRITDPRGYVLIYVGKEHHLADVRGYAYEHRIVAEATIGRRLKKGEEVHHRNEIKSDNSPGNLEVTGSHAQHFARHRKRTDKRNPGDANPVVKCACGCGAMFEKFDEFNRPRKYAVGCSWRKGQRSKSPDETAICACGCGQSFKRYDSSRRERKFANGHNRRKP